MRRRAIQYVLVGGPTLESAKGTYTYERTSGSTATIDLTGTSSGTLTFSSTTAAVYSLAGTPGTGSQSSKVTLVAAPKTDFAPESIGGHGHLHKITSGTGLLSTTGTDETVFSESSDKLVVIGTAPVPSALNHYTYEKFGPDLAIVSFTNSLSQNGYDGPRHVATKATYVTTLDGGLGSQHGSLTVVSQPAAHGEAGVAQRRNVERHPHRRGCALCGEGDLDVCPGGVELFLHRPRLLPTAPARTRTKCLRPGIGYILFNDTLQGDSSDVLLFTQPHEGDVCFGEGGFPGVAKGKCRSSVTPAKGARSVAVGFGNDLAGFCVARVTPGFAGNVQSS